MYSREVPDLGEKVCLILRISMLYIVAGPIGNLKDITFRAIETLKQADVIACEDTRRTGLLLHHYQINTPMESYNDYNKDHKLPKLLKLLKDEKTVALFSDAGTPTISDPGYKLVSLALAKNILVSPIPGPTAAISAISVSGQPTDKFIFIGFLPKQQGKRIKLLNSIKDCQTVSSAIFYESPFRLLRLLEDISSVFGEQTNVTVCNELTKIYEKVEKAPVEEQLKSFEDRKLKGEFTVIANVKCTKIAQIIKADEKK